eukprot:g4859.t1
MSSSKVEEKNSIDEGKSNSDDAAVPVVRITFTLRPDGFQHSGSYPMTHSIAQIKKDVADDLRLEDVDSTSLKLENAELSDADTLQSLGFAANAEINMELHVGETAAAASGGGAAESMINADNGEFPEEIEVTVTYDDDEFERSPKRFIVRIERDERKKPYLGGFRNRMTNIEYHHASAQTARLPVRQTGPEKFTRECQTQILQTRSAQTFREAGSQMARKDLFLDTSKDRVMTSRTYFTSEQLDDVRLRKAIIMQCYWRGYRARCRAWQLRDAQEQRRREIQEEEERQRELAKKRHQREVERRMHPRTFNDFEILYNELESWRSHETDRIKQSKDLSEKERLTQLAQLLHKETALLQTIDRLKNTANRENREIRIKKMLELMSAPKTWQMSDGDVAEVHTPFTTRAKELRELYNGLCLQLLTTDERLDVLLHVKWTVKEFDCNLTREIVDLIDREADLINRGRSEKTLVGLRRRLSNLFLQFIETPEFNPEAARFQKVPRDLMLRPNIRPIGAGVGGH